MATSTRTAEAEARRRKLMSRGADRLATITGEPASKIAASSTGIAGQQQAFNVYGQAGLCLSCESTFIWPLPGSPEHLLARSQLLGMSSEFVTACTSSEIHSACCTPCQMPLHDCQCNKPVQNTKIPPAPVHEREHYFTFLAATHLQQAVHGIQPLPRQICPDARHILHGDHNAAQGILHQQLSSHANMQNS